MSPKSADQLRKQVGQMWRGAVAQLEGVRGSLAKQTSSAAQRLHTELEVLRAERDRLIARLGQQTLTLVNKNQVRLPTVLQPTVVRLNTVIEKITHQKKTAPVAAHPVSKPAAKKPRPAAQGSNAKTKTRAAGSKTGKAAKSSNKQPSNKQPVARKVVVDGT